MIPCRWCGQPIRAALGAWVHEGPGGAFYCRPELAPRGTWPPPPAEPEPASPWPAWGDRAVGRHAVGVAAGMGASGSRVLPPQTLSG